MALNDIDRHAAAIRSIESDGSGGYQAIGPTHPRYGRALGAYQVMEANLPQWTQQAIGRSVGPDEFLANPQIQDAVFRHQFGAYTQKYGSPQDAASAWLTGKPLAEAGNVADVNGTNGRMYVDKFNRALQTRMAPDVVAPRTGGPGERSLNGILDERFQPIAPPRSGPSGERALASGALDERYQPEIAPQAPQPMIATPDLTNGGTFGGLGGLLAKVFAQNQAAQAPQPQLNQQKPVNLANILGGASPNLVIGAQNG